MAHIFSDDLTDFFGIVERELGALWRAFDYKLGLCARERVKKNKNRVPFALFWRVARFIGLVTS